MSYKNRLAAVADTLEEVKAQADGLPVLPTLTNPATDEDVLEGKEFIDANGEKDWGCLQLRAMTTNWETEVELEKTYDSSDVLLHMTSLNAFGDAEPGDVVAGKYFTSMYGAQLEGTHVCESGGATTHTITLNVYGAEFSLWWADNAYTGLTENDHPPTIEVVGDQMIAVFVRYMSAGVTPDGCVGWGSGDALMLDGAEYYGYLFFLYVSGSEPTGSIDIYGY